MLFKSPIPSSEGNPNYIWRNEMNMKNTGFEFEISGDVIKNHNLTWNIALNGTTYKNELTRLPDSKPADKFPDGYKAGNYWRKLGGTLYDWYTYEYEGVNKETGEPQFRKYDKDENGKDKDTYTLVANYSDASLRETGKSAIPDFVGGLTTTVRSYGFDLTVQTAFQFGGWVWDDFYQTLMTPDPQGQNFHRDLFNRWTPSHTDTDIPALNFSQSGTTPNGTFYLTKASYFSLRNVTLGYTLPKKVLKKLGLERFRIYAAGDNLWLLSARKGLDPRQSFDGTTGYVYSALSSYSLGLNLSF